MSFLSNDGYFVSKTILPSNPAAGALPATWTMFYNSTTPADAAGYPVGGGKIWQVTTSIHAPFGYWNDDDIIYNSNTRYIRASASVRQSGYTGPGTGRGGILVSLVVGTRAPGDGLGIIYGVGLTNRAGVAQATDLGSLYIIQGATSNTQFPQEPNFSANQWHRVGIELLGRTLNGYVDSTGYANIEDVPGDHALTYFGSAQATEDTSDDISVGFGIGGAFTLTNYSGIGDLKIEKLEPMGGGSGSSDTSGVPAQTTTPPPVMSPGYGGYPEFSGPTGVPDWFGPTDYGWESSPLRKLDAENSFTYKRFKSARAATNTLNNLVLQP